VAVVLPAAIMTDGVTDTFVGSLLFKATTTPPAGAGVDKVIVSVRPVPGPSTIGLGEMEIDGVTTGVLMLRENVVLAIFGGTEESVTVTDTVPAPAVVGVPEMTPFEALIVRPAGRPVAEKLYCGCPPAALTWSV